MFRKHTSALLVLASFGATSCGLRDGSVATASIAPQLELKESGGGDGDGVFPVEIETVTSTRGRVLVRDAELTYEVGNDDERLATRTRLVDAVGKLGGYVAGEYERSLIIRIPSKHLDEALKVFDALGTITRKSIHVQEVTAQHTDLSIRVDNARRLRTRLQTLLADAKNVHEMLEVEKELARVTEELERYEGQLRDLQNKVALSTLTISFEQAVRPGPVGWVFYGLYKGVKWLFVWD
jgi:hypothetical protein